jgi:hypothetical protein
MQPAATPCPERDILKARYDADFKLYREATRQLDVCQPADFKTVYENAQRAKIAFEKALTALDKHIAEHGCS